jgi:GNAT superfamily N-acetyltransferase
MSITKAEPSELVEIMYLIRVCSIEMNSMGCLYWNYLGHQIPDLLEKGNLYKFKNNESTIGIIIFNGLITHEYEKVNWKFTEGLALPIRIMVHPKWRDKGIYEKLLSYAEQYALEKNYRSIRLDVFANNQFALKVLNQTQYIKAGEIQLPFHSEPFICYEKEISRQ